MDRVRAASGRQKPTAPKTRLVRTYCGIVAFYPTQLGPRSTSEGVEVLGAYISTRGQRAVLGWSWAYPRRAVALAQ